MRDFTSSMILAAAFGLIALPAQSADLTALERIEAAQGCEAALYAYARNLDADSIDAVVDGFAEDGVLITGSGTAQGKDAIRATMMRTRTNRTTASRHVITNVITTIKDKDHCSLTAYQAMYTFDPKNPKANTSLSATLLGVLNDEFVRTAQGWRYAKRHLSAVSAGK